MQSARNPNGINLAIRLNEEQYHIICEAARRSRMKPSQYMREVALTAAGDVRTLEVCLRACLAYLDKKEEKEHRKDWRAILAARRAEEEEAAQTEND